MPRTRQDEQYTLGKRVRWRNEACEVQCTPTPLAGCFLVYTCTHYLCKPPLPWTRPCRLHPSGLSWHAGYGLLQAGREQGRSCILQNRVGGIMAWIPHARLRNRVSQPMHACTSSRRTPLSCWPACFVHPCPGTATRWVSERECNIEHHSTTSNRVLGPPVI